MVAVMERTGETPTGTDRYEPLRQKVNKESLMAMMPALPWRSLFGSAAVGVIVGTAVLLFTWLVESQMLRSLLEAPLWVQLVVPTAGLGLTVLILSSPTRLSSATSDEYIVSYHDASHRLGGWAMVRRVAAGISSLGSGLPLGMEGPSIYLGATLGALFRRRVPRVLHNTDARAFLVAGAAAGVAAVFRAPATGAIFALEVPYQSDVAPRVEIHAMTAAAAAYLVVALTEGTERLFLVSGNPPFTVQDLGGAIVVGLLCGLVARLFASSLMKVKKIRRGSPAFWVATFLVPAGVWAISAMTGEPLGLTGGVNVIDWLQRNQISVTVVVGLLVLRGLITLSAFGAGAVGGVFIPLVTMGALCGQVVGHFASQADPIALSLVGAAAFLAAGYRTPIAALMFVAESTGRAGFVVPGLIGVVAAQFVVGQASVSATQRRNRATRLERRGMLPVRDAMSTTTKAIAPETSVVEFVSQRIPASRERLLPVCDVNRFLGLVVLDDALRMDRDTWAETTVGEIMRTEVPEATPDWVVRDALQRMDTAEIDQLPVLVDGRLVGMIRRRDIQRWDELLERTEQPVL